MTGLRSPYAAEVCVTYPMGGTGTSSITTCRSSAWPTSWSSPACGGTALDVSR